MVSFLGLAIIVTAVVVAVVVAVLGGSLILGDADRKRCKRCHATIPEDAESCTVCEAPFQGPTPRADATPGDEDREPSRAVDVQMPQPDEEGEVINPGVPRQLVRWAVAIMFVGLGVRVLGMLQPAGIETGIPGTVTAALTVIGGIAMFAGFVVSDIA